MLRERTRNTGDHDVFVGWRQNKRVSGWAWSLGGKRMHTAPGASVGATCGTETRPLCPTGLDQTRRPRLALNPDVAYDLAHFA